MKKLKLLLSFFTIVVFTLTSCSSDDSSENSSQFAMTAKINGVLYELNNPFGTNEDSRRIFGYNYNQNDNDYIILQGSSILNVNSLGIEINIFINRNDLKTGTYSVGVDTDEVTTHIDLIDLTTNPTESTISGSITITDIDSTNKTIKGTFEFNSADEPDVNATVNSVVTEGTFSYKYDTN